MKEINEMTLEELKEAEALIKTRKAELKETEKAGKTEAVAKKVAEVDKLIANKTLKVGSHIQIVYGTDKKIIEAEIVGVLSTEKESLTVESNDFDGKVNDKGKKRRYVSKDKFVAVV